VIRLPIQKGVSVTRTDFSSVLRTETLESFQEPPRAEDVYPLVYNPNFKFQKLYFFLEGAQRDIQEI
jgi:hypothetical protein